MTVASVSWSSVPKPSSINRLLNEILRDDSDDNPRAKTYDECFAARQRRGIANVVGTVVIYNSDAKRILDVHQFVAPVKLADFGICVLYKEAESVALCNLTQRFSVAANGFVYCRPVVLQSFACRQFVGFAA